jgi:hypothetical protein
LLARIDPGSRHHGGCSRECDYCADERTERGKPEIYLHTVYLKHSKNDISQTVNGFERRTLDDWLATLRS